MLPDALTAPSADEAAFVGGVNCDDFVKVHYLSQRAIPQHFTYAKDAALFGTGKP